MTPEEMACWIADSPPKRVARGGIRWKALHDRALKVINMTRKDALEQAALVSDGETMKEPINSPVDNIAWAMSETAKGIAAGIRELKEKN